jgi:hypothetical protein
LSAKSPSSLGGPQAVLLGEVFFGINGIPFLHHCIQLFIPHDDGFKNGVFIESKVILPENSHSLAGRDDDLSGVRLDFAGENLEKSRFAGAIGTNDAVTVAGSEFYVDFLEENLVP